MSEPVKNVDQQNEEGYTANLSLFERVQRIEETLKEHFSNKNADVAATENAPVQDAPQAQETVVETPPSESPESPAQENSATDSEDTVTNS